MQWQPENGAGMGDPDMGHMHGEEQGWQTLKSIGKIMKQIDDFELNAQNVHF